MGIFKDIVKKVALAAAVIAGKRILSKVVTDVIDGDKTATEPVAPTPAGKPTTSSRRKPVASRAKPTSAKTGQSKPRTDAKPKAAKIDAAKPRARKPRTSSAGKTKPAQAAKAEIVGNETASQPEAAESPKAAE
ncbi:hypothetical protein ACKF11_09050 [Methylobacillus sp. Pita2]|uniref:hypothetical protein n=1 Tax=Methylobacillus sp. Pita2 TaxID=3383245 RepID=UPI0038B554E9